MTRVDVLWGSGAFYRTDDRTALGDGSVFCGSEHTKSLGVLCVLVDPLLGFQVTVDFGSFDIRAQSTIYNLQSTINDNSVRFDELSSVSIILTQ
jgi:hypothetical protein